MNIVLLNGDMNPESSFTASLKQITATLEAHHSVRLFTIQSMNLKYCIGCWNCWWKTHGECALNDGAEEIFRAYIKADFVLFASPLYAGYVSSQLKKIQERLIVLVHSYFKIVEGECHHQKRYDLYPAYGVLLQKEHDTTDEDTDIVNHLYDRFSLNFHTKRLFTAFAEDGNKKIIDAIEESVLQLHH